MVVEDEERIAGAIAARLRAEGFRVETAATGPDGVELCRRVAPDLVARINAILRRAARETPTRPRAASPWAR